MGDETDSEQKKIAISYLENALKYRESFIQRTMDNFSEKITKSELCHALRDTFFRSYDLRLAIVGKKQQRIKAKSSSGPSDEPL
jgi:hypothetical protein